MADSWLALDWCADCGLGIYVLIAFSGRRRDHNDDHPDAPSLVRSVCLLGPVPHPWGPRPVVPPDRSVGTRRPSRSGGALAGHGSH
jgi:hypothetical protein